MIATKQQIGGAVRRLMASPDWDWLHHDYDDPAEHRAAEILRADARRARAWLLRTSTLAGMPLPRGNGVNGPWHRIPCVTEAGTLGIVDIGAGRAVAYDVSVPSYVGRFSTPVQRAQSANQAGGSGGIPGTWRQIALILVDDPTVRVLLPREVHVDHIIWGLSTCYGTIGDHPSADDHRAEWAAIADAPAAETTDPQREEIDFGKGVEADTWDTFLETRWRELPGYAQITHSGGNWGDLHYVYVTGHREDRESAIAYLRGAWIEYVHALARQAADTVCRRNGVPSLPAAEYAARNP